MPLPRPTIRRHCPFCDWFMDESGPVLPEGAARMGVDPYRFYAEYCAGVEAVLQAHLDSHVDEMVEA